MAPTPSIATRFTQRYGVRHPFACAGMAFAGMTPALTIAVCKAGGIGALGVGFTPPELLREYIRTIRAATDAPFNVNFITCFDNDAQVKVCAEERVPIVSWHWGHPSDANRALLREAGVAYWEQVGSADDALRAVEAGAEAIVAQGYEAGGHNYQGLPNGPGLPIFVLLPSIVDAVGGRAMVLGAGGISDGRGVSAALALGADAVWVGTRMVATVEAAVHDEHKRRIVAAKGEGADRAQRPAGGGQDRAVRPAYADEQVQRHPAPARHLSRLGRDALADGPGRRAGARHPARRRGGGVDDGRGGRHLCPPGPCAGLTACSSVSRPSGR